ncbi:MAG: hypothetical protein E3J72_12150 [Planctomycetota bacterium]|nr:MAG: hypothetical protein E3J72_12150 [Planctomycetota bacterium]
MHLIIPNQPIVISPPTGTSQLPLVEIDKAKVTTKYRPVRIRTGSKKRAEADCSYGPFDTAQLPFSAWEFFHAAKKTELACTFTANMANRRAFAFTLEHEDTFLWNSTNFRKRDSAVFALEDFAETGLAGRVGEAIAYLAMVEWGYVYWDRCATVWARAARNANITHTDQLKVAQYISSLVSSGKPQNEPDFIFEKMNGDVALMEAKGGFVEPGNDYPYTKDVLNQALTQLGAWSSTITPTPAKSYGIATLLREENDAHDDPSLIAYVDPPGRKDSNLPQAELSSDLVRRCNYGAWLIGMGFVSSGLALRELREKHMEKVELPILNIGSRQFAVVTAGWKVPDLQILPFFEPWLLDFPPFRWSGRRGGGVLVMGIDKEILKQIGRAIHNPKEPVLLNLDMGEDDVKAKTKTTTEFPGSIMPDGTLMGTINRDGFAKSIEAMEKFSL